MGALKAGATVSVLDPQYPPERQKILLDVANPKFLICIQKAIKNFGNLSDTVVDFIASNLSIKSTVPALELSDDAELRGGMLMAQTVWYPIDQVERQTPMSLSDRIQSQL